MPKRQSRRYRIRFHLQNGPHFMHWQVRDNVSGEVVFLPPETHTIHAESCKLRNRPRAATKIFDGANKSVCAWVDAERIHITDLGEHGYPAKREAVARQLDFDQVRFNPKTAPNWVDNNGENVDGAEFRELYFCHRSVFVMIP